MSSSFPAPRRNSTALPASSPVAVSTNSSLFSSGSLRRPSSIVLDRAPASPQSAVSSTFGSLRRTPSVGPSPERPSRTMASAEDNARAPPRSSSASSEVSPATIPSVMNPTAYRSSYMANKKAGLYGGSPVAIGRKLGRHLPRIASGDGNDDWDEQRAMLRDKNADDIPRHRRREEPAIEETESIREEVRRERRARRGQWDREDAPLSPLKDREEPPATPVTPVTPVTPMSPKKHFDGTMTPDTPGGDDVQGMRGRLRLSRQPGNVPSTASPLPAPRFGLWADIQRHLLQAYEYLCHVGEAQQWIEGCLGEELGFGVVEMEEGMRNGVVLAKLARVWEGETIVRRIYEHPKLSFRHSDNINYFLSFVRNIGLPECFIFELTDLYDKKNFPKVIYCIHALSHLLARRGLAERMGNLLGRLKFSDDQLRETQRGLKDSGVAMPNFGNVGRELAREINEEPEETEDERRDRMLLENEDSIIGAQAIMRGFLVRRARATQRARLRLAERHITKLQALGRAFLVRRTVQQHRESRGNLGPWVTTLQAAARGVLALRRWRARVARFRSAMRSFVKIQAQARGVLQRRRYARLRAALRSSKPSVVKLQALARARVSRMSHQQVAKIFSTPAISLSVVGLQAAARGHVARRKADRHYRMLQNVERQIVGLQAHARAVIVRRRVRAQLAKLDDVTDIVVRTQAAARAFLSRRRLLLLIRGLRKASPVVVLLQARARANLVRQSHKSIGKALTEMKVIASVGGLQSLARAALARNRHQEHKKRLDFCSPDVLGLQAACRGAMVRDEFWAWREYLRQSQSEATYLQALVRGAMARRRFQAKIQYFRSNLHKVVKIQALYRAKETREQYRQLTLGKNVTVGTIKNFVHLLDDSEADFEDEIDVERLRKRVVEGIRENQALENDLAELDVKIGLVVQNVKSFEEVIKARRRHGADTAAAHAARASVLAAHGDPFAGPNTLDAATRRKLELYQQLFYLLQTHSHYLSRLFYRLSRIELPDVTKRAAERVVLTLFGYGQDRREEYLLLKLLQAAIAHEVTAAPTVVALMSGQPMYISIAVNYVRPKQVTYVKETLQSLIRAVVEADGLDLEVDPVAIYRSRINLEEMQTGMMSSKPKDIPFHQAVNDPETRLEFIQNLQKLLVLTQDFVKVLVQSTRKIPFGMRCLARESLNAFKLKFPHEREETHAAYVGRLIYHRYINPAIVTPETFDILPNTLGPMARKNLAAIAKLLMQITSGQSFGDEDPCLTPLNTFVTKAIKQMNAWLLEVAEVSDPETFFHAHEFLDVTVQPKPVYISPNEVYSMHTLLMQHVDHLTADRTDPLRVILVELEGVPLLGSDELKDARDRAITLELTNRFADVQDPHAEEKALWVQAKRGVLAILRVQPSTDLVESLMQPVANAHESIWEDIVDRELVTDRMRQRRRRMPSTTGMEATYRLEDIQSLSFREVKAHAIYYLLELEKLGKVTRRDGYQAILNAIAGDVRSKHRKRLQRQNEMESMQESLTYLADRKKHFEEQINSYNDYVEGAMKTMQRGKGKKRFVMPFTKQFFHLRDLQKSGKTPQFGSFKYSAQDLYDKGILLSMDQFSPNQFDRVNIVISSNKIGVFSMEIYNTSLGSTIRLASTELRMEDLLQAQFESRVSLPLFDGMAKVNLNLLLYQINKKFYV